MSEPTPWAQERRQQWESVLGVLRSEGWIARLTGLAAPVQVEGLLPTGERFYFRARHDEVSLSIGPDDAVDSPEWSGSEPYGRADDDDASYTTGNEGLRLIRRLEASYRGENPS